MLTKFKADHMKDRLGRTVTVLQPLVQKGYRPDRGWISSITIHGTKMTLSGSRPMDVYRELKRILELNRIPATENEIWTTLNLDWLSRTRNDRHLVNRESFLAGCEAPSTDKSFPGAIDDNLWLDTAIDTVGWFLAIDEDRYRFSDFDNLLKTLVKMADPGHSHKLGSHRVFATLLERYSVISYTPAHKIEDARSWFVITYNAIALTRNLTPIPKASVINKYHW